MATRGAFTLTIFALAIVLVGSLGVGAAQAQSRDSQWVDDPENPGVERLKYNQKQKFPAWRDMYGNWHKGYETDSAGVARVKTRNRPDPSVQQKLYPPGQLPPSSTPGPPGLMPPGWKPANVVPPDQLNITYQNIKPQGKKSGASKSGYKGPYGDPYDARPYRPSRGGTEPQFGPNEPIR